MLDFNPNDFSINIRGQKVLLLPKEYALFHFLYHNAQLTFSREQLLEAIWGLEDPGERTVDDHIYRLRRKLKDFELLFKIETVRGLGYRLILNYETSKNPLQNEPELNEKYSQIIDQYWLFGQGDAMGLLARNKELLGFTLNPFYELYLNFVSGDFLKVLKFKEVSFTGKLFYLIHIYRIIQFDANKSLEFFEMAITKNLSQNHSKEIQLNLVSLYLETGQLSKAQQLIEEIIPKLQADEKKGYTLFFYVDLILFNFLKGDNESLKRLVQELEGLLLDFPYRRELGLFKVVKGLWLLYLGELSKGRMVIREGVEELKLSYFTPHYLYGIHLILYMLSNTINDPATKKTYQELWDLMSYQYRFSELEGELYPYLLKNL